MTDTLEVASANGNNTMVPRKESLTADSQSPPSNTQSTIGRSPKKRRKVNHACVYCRRSHMTCDEDRPCSRCIKRNIGHLCHDEPREAKKPKAETTHENGQQDPKLAPAKAVETSPVNGMPPPPEQAALITQIASSMPPPRNSSTVAPTIVAPSPVSAGSRSNFAAPNAQAFLGLTDWDFLQAGQPTWVANPYHQQWMFSANEAADEFSTMSDWVGNFHEGDSLFGENLFDFTQQPSDSLGEILPQTNNIPQEKLIPPPLPPIIRPASVKPTEKARESYYLTAADPSKDVPEEKMKQVLRAKYQAGLLKPFNYVKGYARLSTYMENHFQATSRQKIARQLDKFRPKFREKTQKLTDLDLVSVEEWFEKTLMEYDRVFASMAVPACLWRRTGEIFRGNREFAELINVPTEKLRDGKLAIYELIAEESFFCYWEKFGSIAFDTSQKAMLTSCLLKNPNPQAENKYINCCFSFTIRRDAYDIPCAIVGNFIPIYS